ncbi:hypothetical protein KKE03_03480 [Patescibacteria group bacterium]|nr:hypothetical protein [Patescibacteria group bacterium]
MKFTKTNTIISLLIITIGVLLYFLNDYKTRYESTKTWLPPSFCSDENLKDINFLLNTENSNFSKARAIVALKDNGCFYKYPELIKSAQELVDKENEVVKIVKGTDLVSVELLREFEKDPDPLRLFQPKDTAKDEAVLELTGLITKFMDEMEKRSSKELEKYFTE